VASRFRGGWQIRDGRNFNVRAIAVLGSLERWDEIRSGLDHILNRDPHVGANPIGNYWLVQAASIPPVVLCYEVDEERRIVTYDNLLEG